MITPTHDQRARALLVLAVQAETTSGSFDTVVDQLDAVLPSMSPMDRIEALGRVQRRVREFGPNCTSALETARLQAHRHDRRPSCTA